MPQSDVIINWFKRNPNLYIQSYLCKQSHYQGQTQACNFIFSIYEKLGCETGVPL